MPFARALLYLVAVLLLILAACGVTARVSLVLLAAACALLAFTMPDIDAGFR